MKRFDRIVTLSEFDQEYLRRLWPQAPVVTVPIPAGMDLTPRTFARASGTVLFLASFKYRPDNTAAALWFYREVFPLVRARVPGVRFVVTGHGPPEELRALAADPSVEVTGFVADLDRCYKEAAVFVAPIMTGGGIIVKVLDALAAGTPVVTTSYGNEGVGGVPGRDLLVADDAPAFAEAVGRLLTDSAYAERLAASGRTFVAERYGVETVLARLEAVYAGLVKDEG